MKLLRASVTESGRAKFNQDELELKLVPKVTMTTRGPDSCTLHVRQEHCVRVARNSTVRVLLFLATSGYKGMTLPSINIRPLPSSPGWDLVLNDAANNLVGWDHGWPTNRRRSRTAFLGIRGHPVQVVYLRFQDPSSTIAGVGGRPRRSMP
eukprot:7631141-Pyramimonas_sp.AAC.1